MLTRLPLPNGWPSVLPCVVCFSGTDSAVQSGINAGVFVLLGVTSLVLVGFAALIARIVWRTRSRGVS